jgi:hypothetical protein
LEWIRSEARGSLVSIIKLRIPNLEIIVIRDIEFSKCYMLLDILPDPSQGRSVAIATNNASELVTVDEEARVPERVLAFWRTKGGDEKPHEVTFSYSGTHVTYRKLGALWIPIVQVPPLATIVMESWIEHIPCFLS